MREVTEDDQADVLKRATQRMVGARRRYAAMLAADRQALPTGDPELARPLIGLATIELEMGRYADAEQHFVEATELLEKTEPRETRALAFAIGGRADGLVQQGRPAEAAPLYRRAIALLEEDRQQASPRELGALMANLACVYALTGQPEKASPLYNESLDLLRKAHGPRHTVVGRVLHDQADVYVLLGQSDLARVTYEQALELNDAALPSDDPELTKTLDGLATLLVRMREYERAEQLLQRALGIHESTTPANPVAFGHTLSSLGLLYASQNRMDAAETTLLRALGLLVPELGAADPLVLETRREYDLVVRSRRLGTKEVEGL